LQVTATIDKIDDVNFVAINAAINAVSDTELNAQSTYVANAISSVAAMPDLATYIASIDDVATTFSTLGTPPSAVCVPSMICVLSFQPWVLVA
jgi:hypothetical protein